MAHMGFDPKWINWIMTCITTVSYSVMVNGSPMGFIQPSRGIRQGDPLSPYLFILCSEVLSHQLLKAARERKIQGIKISNQSPMVNHLLFADDSLFFTLANDKSAKGIKRVLSLYEAVSGQSINLNKSAITFGRKVKPEVKTRMRRILGIHNDGGGGKYLGIPEQFGRKKADMFRYITEKVKERTEGWHKQFLSPGGKEILLKSVALAMPVHSMNVFKLPKGICDDINDILAKFWWGTTTERKRLHWLSWKRLGIPKKEGGLGFREIESFNLALLGKQVWRILQHPTCLMARVLKGRYFHGSDVLNAGAGTKPSFIWKSLLEGRNLVKQGMRIVIGNGELTNVWKDAWLPTHPPRAPLPKLASPQDFHVTDWFNSTRTGWNETILREHVHEDDVARILSIHIGPHNEPDIMGWHYSQSGLYTVKSAYWLATHTPNHAQIQPPSGSIELKHQVWKLGTAPKIKHFLWKLLSGTLPTGDNLERRHIVSNLRCCRCLMHTEDTKHIFFECLKAKEVWESAGIPIPEILDTSKSLETKLTAIFSYSRTAPTDQGSNQLPIWIIWRLWRGRNFMAYQHQDIPRHKTLSLAYDDARDWQHVKGRTSLSSVAPSGSRIQTKKPWRKPLGSWLKCNYDGSFHNSDTPSTSGWLIRDSRGVFIGAGQVRGFKVNNALESELQSLLVAMQNCWIHGHRCVIFEGDSQLVYRLITNKSLNFGVLNWLRDIRTWATRFQDIQFEWIAREGNKAADKLAKHHFSSIIDSIFYDYVPVFLTHELHRDYSLSS